MNRITEILLNRNSTRHEIERLEHGVNVLNESLDQAELDSLRSAVVDQ
jgi:hypothetical protein